MEIRHSSPFSPPRSIGSRDLPSPFFPFVVPCPLKARCIPSFSQGRSSVGTLPPVPPFLLFVEHDSTKEFFFSPFLPPPRARSGLWRWQVSHFFFLFFFFPIPRPPFLPPFPFPLIIPVAPSPMKPCCSGIFFLFPLTLFFFIFGKREEGLV